MGKGDIGSADEADVAGQGQGKEKAINTTPEKSNVERDSNGNGSAGLSAMSRITNSVTALASSMMSPVNNANDMGHVLPMSKAESSSTGQKLSIGDDLSYKTKQVQNGPGNKFSSAHVADYMAHEEAAFSAFLDGTSVQTSLDASDEPLTGTLADSASRRPHISQTQDYSETDGLEVVKLLDSGYDEVATFEPDIPLSRDEKAALRRSLFGQTEPGGQTAVQTRWDNVLNFFPEFISNGTSGWGYNEISQHLGTSDINEARAMWVDQWKDVLSGYTDEVWGGLNSLVAEAVDEIQDLSEPPKEASPSGLKALRRLRQVLAHIRDG